MIKDSREELYSKFSNMVITFTKENNLPCSEDTYLLLAEVLENLRESWYRKYLGKR